MKNIKRIITMIMILLFIVSISTTAFDLGTDYDFEGETITFLQTSGYPFFEHVDEAYEMELEERRSEAEEKFNCTIEVVGVPSRDYYTEAMDLIMAGDANYTIMNPFREHYWSLAEDDALYPVEEILGDEYYEQLDPLRKEVHEMFEYDSTRYIFGDRPSVRPLTIMYWNKDLFEREGLPDLYELIENKEWTWDVMREIAVEATKDTDGDDEIDQWGFTGRVRHPNRWSMHFSASNAALPIGRDEDRNVVFKFHEEPGLQVIREVSEWIELDITGPHPGVDEFKEGRIALDWDRVLDLEEHKYYPDNLDFSIGVAPLPMGPNADDYHYPIMQNYNKMVLPVTAEKPEALIALYKYIFSEEGTRERNFDYIDRVAPDRESVEILREAYDNFDPISAPRVSFMFIAPHGGTLNEARDGDVSASAAMEELRPQIQAELDEFFDQ